MREYTDIRARIGVGLTTWWFPPMIRKGGRHVSPSDLAYEMRVTSPRDLAYEMRPPHAYHWALLRVSQWSPVTHPRVTSRMRCETHPCVTSRMRLAYEMWDTSPRDLAYEMRPPHAYHWAQWCVRITREYDIGVGLTFLRDDFPLWYARAVDTSPRDLAYEMRDTSLRDLAYEMRPPHAYHWALQGLSP